MSVQIVLTPRHEKGPANFADSEIITGADLEENKNRVKDTYSKVSKIVANYEIVHFTV